MDRYTTITLIAALFFFFLSCLLLFLVIKAHLARLAERRHSLELSQRIKSLMRNFSLMVHQKEDLERINDMRSKFISVVAHDLKQPVTLINGYSSLLRDNISSEDGKLLDNIERASSSIGKLALDLGDISVADFGQTKLSFSKFSFNDFIAEIYNQYRAAAAFKKIDMRLISYPEEIIIEADRFRLGQVFNNILSNALKFTPEGGTVEIRYAMERDLIKTMIKDDGLGINHPDRVKIFDKFQQSDFIEDNIKKQGWGLGLFIAEEIISGHGGIIGADSAGAGAGSTFWIALPKNRTKQYLQL